MWVRFVGADDAGVIERLAGVLKSIPMVNAFCEALWPHGDVKVTGGASLLKRLTGVEDESSAKRWLELLNRRV